MEFPFVFLTDNMERYVGEEAPMGPGIAFTTGNVTSKDQADLYVEKNGELVAPYGFCRLDIDGESGPFGVQVNAEELDFTAGAFGIANPREAFWSMVLPYVWIIKTADGGYARVHFSFVRRNQDWGLLYEYSSTGKFPAH